MIFAITDRDPTYLKAVYPSPVELVNIEGEIPAGAGFITWGGGAFLAWRLTLTRDRIPLGRYKTAPAAILAASR